MSSIRKSHILVMVIIALFMGTSINMGVNAMSPDEASDLTSLSSDNTSIIQLEDGTEVEMQVDGNVTHLYLEDGTIIIVNASEQLTVVNIISGDTMTNISYGSKIDYFLLVYNTGIFDNFEIGPDQPVLRITEQNTTSGDINTELTAMSLTSPDPLDSSRGFRIFGTAPSSKRLTEYPVDSFFDIFFDVDNDTSMFSFFSGNVLDPNDPSSIQNGVTITGEFNYTDDPYNFGFFNLSISENNAELGLDMVDMSLITGANSGAIADSFFDIFYDVLSSNTPNPQSHSMIGQNNVNRGVTEISWTNRTDGVTNSSTHNSGSQPTTGQWPSANPTSDPYTAIEIVLTDSYVGLSYAHTDLLLFRDKLVLNYLTSTGYYIPIVIYYILHEVVIVYEYVTVVVYLEVVDLITVIIVNETIKIEVYYEYIVITYAVYNTIIEIDIYLVEFNIYYIEISITIDIWIIQFIIIFVDILIVLPVWIIIIPIIIQKVRFIFLPFPVIVPIFIPIFVPIIIPVPTPTPYVMPTLNIDIFKQKFDKNTNTMDLSYNVTDEYNQPVTGANVDVTVNGVSYTAVEDTTQPGIYDVNGIPYQPNATIEVIATIPYRPVGYLIYTQTVLDNSTPVTSTSNNTITATITNTITNTVANSTGSGFLPFDMFSGILAIVTSIFVTAVARRRKIKIKI